MTYSRPLTMRLQAEEMMKSPIVVGIAIAVLALTSRAAAAQSGPVDTQHGRELAAKLCSNCHAVPNDPSNVGRPDVPSFAAIARKPNITPERIAGAIVLPHPEMPGVPLSRAEIRDIAAYILSLR
jgi:mono/diheme cytochrome c family protein